MEQHHCYGCMSFITEEVCPHCGESAAQQNGPDQLPRGTVLQGQYLVGRVLGQGGFGITYIGLDTQLDMVVAIKEFYPSAVVNRDVTQGTTIRLNSESSRDHYESILERFIREARALGKLQNAPQVVRVLRFFRENNTAYIVMEYVQGKDLRHLVREKGGKLTAQELFPILKPVLTALNTVHKAGLVHRDISPDNIMIQPDGSPKLLDFGAVRDVGDSDADIDLSHSTEAILKHGFAPMEQYRSRGNLGPWTDEYGICATVHYCLTGKVPPDAPARAMGEEDVDWSIVPGLEPYQRAALEKGMSMRAKDRFGDLEALSRAIFEKPMVTQTVKPMEPEKPAEPPKKKKKKKRRVGLTIFILLLLLLVLAVSALAAAVVGISVFAYLYPQEGAAIMEDVGIPMDTIDTFVIETGLTPEVVAEYLEKAGITEEEIMAWMQEKGITPERLAELVEKSGITEDTIRAIMEKFMIIPDLIDVFTKENRLGEETGGTDSTQWETEDTVPRVTEAWEKNEMATRPLEILERMGIARSTIRHVTFLDSLESAPEYTIDISKQSDGSVLAWLDWSGECRLYIGADGYVNGNNSCQSLFLNCTNLSTVTFGGCFRTDRAYYMSKMFEGCVNLEAVDVENLNTSNVHSMTKMFCMVAPKQGSGGLSYVNNEKLTSLDVSGWDLGRVTDCESMFSGCKALQNLDVSRWDVGSVKNTISMFSGCENLKTLDVSRWDTDSLARMQNMFSGCKNLQTLAVRKWNLENVTNCSGAFSGCESLKELDTAKWNVEKVTDMSGMFRGCVSLETLDVSRWDAKVVKNMSAMFSGCAGLKSLDTGKWTIPWVRNLKDMFSGCASLENLDVSNWSLSNVTDMDNLFSGCSALRELDVSGWNVYSVITMEGMFRGTAISKVDVSGWNVGKVKNMKYMFFECSELMDLDLTGWKTSLELKYDHFCSKWTTINGQQWERYFWNR